MLFLPLISAYSATMVLVNSAPDSRDSLNRRDAVDVP